MTEGIRTSNPAIALPLYLAILVLFAIQTAINVKLYRSSDEFLRNTMLVTCSVTFAICQGMLFLWAAAERMTLVPSLSSWSAMSILMTVYISVSFFTSLRQFR
jgi:multidrug transporter EmrE-like cation transporter